MLNHRFFLKNVHVILFLVTMGTAFAQAPVVSLDCNPEKDGVCPPPASVIAGETILMAVTVRDVHNLHSYSVKCLFDPQVVMFTGAVARLSPLTPAFLEMHQARLAAFLSFPGNGLVEIAATQAGDDSSKCAEGDGVLGYLYFTAKTNGNPDIKISEARLVAPDGKSITAEIN